MVPRKFVVIQIHALMWLLQASTGREGRLAGKNAVITGAAGQVVNSQVQAGSSLISEAIGALDSRRLFCFYVRVLRC